MTSEQDVSDGPRTVTAFKNGVPAVEIKVGDVGSARAVASTYLNRGQVVEIKATRRES